MIFIFKITCEAIENDTSHASIDFEFIKIWVTL